MTLTDFETEIIQFIQSEQQRGICVNTHRLSRKFDEGIVWGIGYRGVAYHADRLVKKGALIKRQDFYHYHGEAK